MRNKNLNESFTHAFEGLSHVLWTQRHVRIQLGMVMLVFVLSYVMHLETVKMLFVLSAISAVLIAELFNTAIEVVVNMVTENYHPLAKVAKDVAAAGVLIASMYALLVGCGIFLNGQNLHTFAQNAQILGNIRSFTHHITWLQHLHPPSLIVVVMVGFFVVSILVALAKVRVGHGTLLRGGAVSGHAAVAFLLFAAVVVYSQFNPALSLLAFFLAVLVAQSRVEGKIHSVAEVIRGAVVAIVLMVLLVIFA